MCLHLFAYVSVYVCVCVAPAPVVDLHIQHSDETLLSVMWSHAPFGWRDGYFLTLFHGESVISLPLPCTHTSHLPDERWWRLAGNATVDTRVVGPDRRECTFNVLTPGRGYTIAVATVSGNLSSSVSVEGRTGESRRHPPPP